MQRGKTTKEEWGALREEQGGDLVRGDSDLAVVEQIAGTNRKAVSAVAAQEVSAILGDEPVFLVEEENKENTNKAYQERTYWYFGREGRLIGRAAVVTYADGRVEGLWWNKNGRRPKMFDYFESPPFFLPG